MEDEGFEGLELEKLSDLSNRCINCLLCVQVCPILGDNILPTNTYPQMIVNMFKDPTILKFTADIVYQCLLCDECRVVCPRNIETTKAVLTIRRIINKKKLDNK